MAPTKTTIANSQFGLDLFKFFFEKSAKNLENSSVSPLSVQAALGLVHLGARGETATEIRQALRWDSSTDDQDRKMHEQMRDYLTLLDSKVDAVQVSCANRMYLDKHQNVLEEFKAATKELYLAEPEAADFQGDVEAARTAINSWVSQETQNKIENLLSQGSLSTFTRLVLVNALYFKGEWKILFNERLTRPGPFKVSGDVTKDVPIMRTQGRFPFVQDTELQCTAVAMPYVGADLDMVVVVPHRESSLTDLVDKLTSESFNSLLSDMDRYPNQIYLSLPKFQVTASSNLKDALSALGMSSAFLEKEADLSGISPDKDLFVSAVEHKVHVAVDEKGAEAAAATAVVANSFSMSPPEIDVDRPFLFAIRDKRPGGGLLFLGSVFDPQA